MELEQWKLWLSQCASLCGFKVTLYVDQDWCTGLAKCTVPNWTCMLEFEIKGNAGG